MANPQPVDYRTEIMATARERLANTPYARWFTEISLELKDGVLTIRGSLPSFYAKQVLQTSLRNLPGVVSINNQTEVLSFVNVGHG